MKDRAHPVCNDNAPTAERMKRNRFRREGEALRLWSTVRWLYDAGDIGDDEVTAAQRWRAEFDYAENGIVVAAINGPPVEKGDIHTWMLGRGKCAARLRHLRQILGASLYSRIDMMLVRDMSFPDMARLIYPECVRAQARTKTAAQCALALERLSEYYRKKKIELL